MIPVPTESEKRMLNAQVSALRRFADSPMMRRALEVLRSDSVQRQIRMTTEVAAKVQPLLDSARRTFPVVPIDRPQDAGGSRAAARARTIASLPPGPKRVAGVLEKAASRLQAMEIARQTGLAESSVRVYVGHLKSRGFDISNLARQGYALDGAPWDSTK